MRALGGQTYLCLKLAFSTTKEEDVCVEQTLEKEESSFWERRVYEKGYGLKRGEAGRKLGPERDKMNEHRCGFPKAEGLVRTEPM